MRSRTVNGRVTNTRRRAAVLALVGIVAMVVGTSPAIAAKGGRPGGPEPATVTVTMEGNIATTDACGGPLRMNLDGTSLTMEWSDTAVEMKLDQLTGCHGPFVYGSDSDGYPGNLSLTLQRDGTVKLMSLFDYFWEFETIGKRVVQKTLDLWSINGNLTGDFDWSPGGGGELSGDVLLKHFHKDYKDGEWTEEGTFPVTLSVEIVQ